MGLILLRKNRSNGRRITWKNVNYCIGSILIFGLGLNLVLGSKIKIGNLLPAVFLPIIACLLGF